MISFRQLLIITLLAACTTAAAGLSISMTPFCAPQSGRGNPVQILHNGLRSGTRLELLEESDSGYSRVRTPDGQENRWSPAT